MAFGRLERTKGQQPISDINVTPLVDVMLVLVVIFILTAPLLATSIRLDLPTLAQRLSQAAADAPDTEIQLRADAAVPYGRIVEVMGVAQKAGLNHIGFVAEPPSVP